jgi:transcriptional regulator with XRE-family HTH domain
MKVTGDASRFGTRLRSYMHERKLTVNDVAAALGVNQSTVRKICSGENVTQYLQLANLAGIIGVTPNDLLGFDKPEAELEHLLPAVQGVIEQLGHDRGLARLAAEIALRAAEEQRILEEDAATEIRVRAKLLLSQSGHPKLPK